MPHLLTRRGFLGGTVVLGSIPAASRIWAATILPQKPNQRFDSSITTFILTMLSRWINVERSRETGVKFGIVEHAGTKANRYPHLISNDEQMTAYLAKLEGKPVLRGIQAEGVDWMTCFSKETLAKLDYVLSDALTLPEKNGSRTEIWRLG